MKFFAPALIFCGAAAFGQSPQVPHKMQFAGMTLSVRDDARREIQKDVDALTLSPKHFNIKAERAKTYFPIIEKIFAEERLPDDFKYLCLQESALIPDAVSSSNAVGFWQFKDFTAKEMGLRIDAEVDERMNIVSASRAAARYLKQNNHYFNNWIYALQSYQMGAGGVMRAVGEKDLGVRHMEITTDTYWYVKKFLAHKVAFENAVQGKPAVEVSHVFTVGGKTTREIAIQASVDEMQLKEFNKWLKTSVVPSDKEYAVLIPRGNVGAEFGVLALAPAKSRPAVEPVSAAENLTINGVPVIRASKGETLVALATRGNLSLKKFLRYNEMTIDMPLQAGQLYFVDKKKNKASAELYTLKPEDNLWTVSQRFGVRQKSLIKFNKLAADSKVTAGTTLYLSSRNPGGSTSFDGTIALLDEDDAFVWDQTTSNRSAKSIADRNTPKRSVTISSETTETSTPVETSETALTIHEVRPSDTLYSVARQYGVTIQELMEWNDKKDFSVSIGEKLKVRSR